MATRPLRQYYDEDLRIEVGEDLGELIEPWIRHRRRFAEHLGTLNDDAWTATTRCGEWDARDVISHLITADGFWVVSLRSAAAGTPTSFLPEFDPSASPEALVAPMREMPTSAVLDQFRAGTDSFVDAVMDHDPAAWSATAESPLGHVTARLALAHAHWDSWLHERDIFVPLGAPPPVESDELLVSTWYLLVAGAVQGGLLDDPSPVGPGLDALLDVTVAFDELADPLHLVIDDGVRIERGSGEAVSCGSALDLVEAATGRGGHPVGDGIPEPLADHLGRAFAIL